MPDPQLTVYTNLFTLASKEPAQNRYVDMFYIWFSAIIRKGGLGPADTVFIMIDERTYAHVSAAPLFQYLVGKIGFRLFALTYAPPATLKEGTLRRFEVERLYEQAAPAANRYLYLDIDVLTAAPLHGLYAGTEPNCLCYAAESIPTEKKYVFLDDNYFGPLATDEDVAWLEARFGPGADLPGMTSGTFAFTDGAGIRAFFRYILAAAAADERQHYTLDQPYYVAAIYKFIMREGLVCHTGFSVEHIRVNIPSYQAPSTAILLNFCGDPGDESSHWYKLLAEAVAAAF